MTITPIIDHSPGAMSRRARIYIIAGGLRHLLIGLSVVAFPWLYSSAAFIPIFNFVDSQIWAWAMVVVGIVCLTGSITRNADIGRAGMVGSACVTAVLAAGLTLGVINLWLNFGHQLGNDALMDLIRARPAIFPVELAVTMVAPPSPFLPLLLLSVSVKDFTMCAQPLRVPVEDVGSRGFRSRET